MLVISDIKETQNWCINQKSNGKKIGLVPTMGFLHEGHLQLIKKARSGCDVVVVSIFVNPIQFGEGEDYEVYPRDLNRDMELLRQERVDLLFTPGAAEMYPPGFSAAVEIQGPITEKMCGRSRPGHFRGVTTVVSKLFNICQPDLAFFGQKDAQQAAIVEKMVRELCIPVTIVRVPIVREKDGLAMSSRNAYLDPQQRQDALVLSQALNLAQYAIGNGEKDVATVKRLMTEKIESVPGTVIDYIEISNGNDLSELESVKGTVLLALAVKIGRTRLIDNMLVEV